MLGYTLRSANENPQLRTKGLKRFYEDENAKGLPADTVDKLRKMLAYLDNIEDPEELRSLPSWKPHLLAGDRKGT